MDPLPPYPEGSAAAAAVSVGAAGGEAVKLLGESSDDNRDDSDDDDDEGIVGVGLPRMLGLVPEGNAELASTFAWEDDILWEGAAEADTTNKGEGAGGGSSGNSKRYHQE